MTGFRQAGTEPRSASAASQTVPPTVAFTAGAVRTAIGSYDDAFVISGLLCLTGPVLVLTIARKIANPAPLVVPSSP